MLLLVCAAVVNTPSADFGRLPGVPVAVLRVSAQRGDQPGFSVALSVPVLTGGARIVAGGLPIAVWR